jgi:hypothetical protein
MMRTNASVSVGGLVFAAGATLLVAACTKEDKTHGRERSPNEAQMESKVPIASAVESIVRARCDREARCNDVGPDRQYASMDACASKIRADWRDDLTFTECPGGVDARELNDCMQEIRDERCGNPFDTLGRVVACRSSELCRAAR